MFALATKGTSYTGCTCCRRFHKKYRLLFYCEWYSINPLTGRQCMISHYYYRTCSALLPDDINFRITLHRLYLHTRVSLSDSVLSVTHEHLFVLSIPTLYDYYLSHSCIGCPFLHFIQTCLLLHSFAANLQPFFELKNLQISFLSFADDTFVDGLRWV